MVEHTTTHRRVTRQADLPLSGSFDAVWTLTEYAREGSDTERRGRVRYAMVAESSHVSRVSIDLRPADRGCTARVRYDLTGLTAKGDDFIEGVTHDCFDGWIAEWRQAIEHYLSTGERLVSHRVQPVEGAAGDAGTTPKKTTPKETTHKERIDG